MYILYIICIIFKIADAFIRSYFFWVNYFFCFEFLFFFFFIILVIVGNYIIKLEKIIIVQN